MLGAPDLPSALGPFDRGHCRSRLLRAGAGIDQLGGLVAALDDHPADESDARCVVLVFGDAGIEPARLLREQDAVVAITRGETYRLVEAEHLRLVLGNV